MSDGLRNGPLLLSSHLYEAVPPSPESESTLIDMALSGEWAPRETAPEDPLGRSVMWRLWLGLREGPHHYERLYECLECGCLIRSAVGLALFSLVGPPRKCPWCGTASPSEGGRDSGSG